MAARTLQAWGMCTREQDQLLDGSPPTDGIDASSYWLLARPGALASTQYSHGERALIFS